MSAILKETINLENLENRINTPVLQEYAKRIDHVAIAVLDLENSIQFYRDILGFKLTERRETKGKTSGMISAVLEAGDFTFVLIQGTEPESQVSEYIQKYGPGVQHVAIEVDDLVKASEKLKEHGYEFATNIIHGAGLDQIFSKRDPGSGMMIELIQRTGEVGFQDGNVQDLFEQLEKNHAF